MNKLIKWLRNFLFSQEDYETFKTLEKKQFRNTYADEIECLKKCG